MKMLIRTLLVLSLLVPAAALAQMDTPPDMRDDMRDTMPPDMREGTEPGTPGMPGMPTMRGDRTDSFSAAGQDAAQGMCDEVARANNRTRCTAVRAVETTRGEQEWYCQCE